MAAVAHFRLQFQTLDALSSLLYRSVSAHRKPKASSGHVDFPKKVGTECDWLVVNLWNIMLIIPNQPEQPSKHGVC